MQLDHTRIVVRERGIPELFDLTFRVCRAFALPLAATIALGAAPMIALNIWLIRDHLADVEFDVDLLPTYSYLWRLGFLIVLEIPLAAVPTTLFLSQVMFRENLNYGQMAKDALTALPQLALYQLLPRGLLVLWAVTADSPGWIGLCSFLLLIELFLRYAVWPYLNEVILLERNPIFRKSSQGMSTLRRALALHSRNAGDLFGRWLVSLLFGGAWAVALWLALAYGRFLATGSIALDVPLFTVYLQLALWIVIGYFHVARFLSYLDLRIRNEGWEIELRLRAAAARLQRQLV